tara:strand:+ start:1870 stop:2136 length:267 start_codon:yes stop_codon:yes gene_type:complete
MSETRGTKKISIIIVRALLSVSKEDSTARLISSKKTVAEQKTAIKTALSGHEEYRLPSVNIRPSKVPRACISTLKATTIIKNALDLQI